MIRLRFRIVVAFMPYLGFGRYMPDGIFISCTFNYIERDASNVAYVLLLIVIDVVGKLALGNCIKQ